MDSRSVGTNGGLPDATGSLSNAPTLDQVYAAIMSQKRKAQELPPVPAAAPEPVRRIRSGNGSTLRNNTLEQLLLQGLASGQEDGPLAIMRSNTMENIFRETLSAGRELQDLLLEWNRSLPEEKLVEGLASDMQAIDAAPPDAQTMRRTFTLERILSGVEGDLAASAVLRTTHHNQHQHNPSTQHHQQQLHHHHQQQQMHPLARQYSGGAAAVAGTSVGREGHGGEEVAATAGTRPASAAGGGSSSRPAERLQRQESLHRLASSYGPSQQPTRLPNNGTSTSTGAVSHSQTQTQPHSHIRTAPAAAPGAAGAGGCGIGLLRSAHGSGRYGAAAATTAAAAAAAVLATEEESAAMPRSPKRHKLLHHHHHHHQHPHAIQQLKADGDAPARTWSQSLLDLAKAAAALDGCDLDEVDNGGGGEAGGGSAHAEGGRGLRTPPDNGGGGGGEDGQQPRHVRQHHQQQQQQQWLQTGEAGSDGGQHECYGAAAEAAAAAAVAALERRMDGGGGDRGGNVREKADCSLGGGGGGVPRLSVAAAGVRQSPLLRSLSGMKSATGSQQQQQQPGLGQQLGGLAGGCGSSAEPSQPSTQDTKLLLRLQAEADRLQRDNAGLSDQLEAVLAQVDLTQRRNGAMKQMLLEACHAKGIPADMELLNVSLHHHREAPMSEAKATHVAATVLGLNGGDVMATVQHLIGIALLRIAEGSNGGGAGGGGGGGGGGARGGGR